MDPIGHGPEPVRQELQSSASVGCFNALGEGELGGPVDAYQQLKPIVVKTVPPTVSDPPHTSSLCNFAMSMWKKAMGSA